MNEALFIFSYSTLYSLLEIELEAKEGWCKNLPTPVVLGKFTLYHVLMNIIVIISFISEVFWRFRIHEPASISGIRFNHPEVGMIFCNIGIGVDTPFFVGTADPINPNLFFNMRCVMQRLG